MNAPAPIRRDRHDPGSSSPEPEAASVAASRVVRASALRQLLDLPQGKFIVFGALVLLILAFTYSIQHVYVMFALMVSIPAASYWIARTTPARLTVVRSAPHRMIEGETATVTFRIRNDSRVRKLLFRIADELPQWLQAEPPDGVRVPEVRGRESVTHSYRITAQKRGVYRLGPAALLAQDTLGLFRFAHEVADPCELVVYPACGDVRALQLSGALPFYGAVSTQHHIGDALEFHSIRDYLPGDELRRIHWKSTARTGEFTVVEFERNVGGSITIALDLARNTEFGEGKHTTLEAAIRLAAALAKCALSSGGAVRLIARGDHDWSASAERGLDDLPAILEPLARAQADGPDSLAQVLRTADAELQRAGGLVLLTADPDSNLLEIVQRLRSRGRDVALILLRADTFASGDAQREACPSAADYERLAARASALRANVRQIFAGADPVLQLGGRGQ